jgi:hypothetical protein
LAAKAGKKFKSSQPPHVVFSAMGAEMAVCAQRDQVSSESCPPDSEIGCDGLPSLTLCHRIDTATRRDAGSAGEDFHTPMGRAAIEWLSGESFQDAVSRGANACFGQRRREVGADQKWTRKVPFIHSPILLAPCHPMIWMAGGHCSVFCRYIL